MARILFSELSHKKVGSNWEFKVKGKARFRSHEREPFVWRVNAAFFERDTFLDDSLGFASSNTLAPSMVQEDLAFEIVRTIPDSQVDTEWGKEEVYANLALVPLNPPDELGIDKDQTNAVKVNT